MNSTTCPVCQSPLRQRVEQLLAVHATSAANTGLVMPLGDIAEWIEAWRVKHQPDIAALTVTDISQHAREHRLLPVVPPGSDVVRVSGEVVENVRIETVLASIINEGAVNIRAGFMPVTGTMLMQALRLQYDLERAHGSSKDEIAEALEEIIRRSKKQVSSAA